MGNAVGSCWAPDATPHPGLPQSAAAVGGPAAFFAADLWDAPRAQRPEWAAVLAEARALSEGSPSTVQSLTDGAAQALLRGGGGAAASTAGRGRPSGRAREVTPEVRQIHPPLSPRTATACSNCDIAGGIEHRVGINPTGT